MTILLQQADTADLAAINARYAAIDFMPSHAGELIVIAHDDGAVCGQGRVVPVDAASGELGGIFVLPGYEGRGVARRIVQYLIDHARQQTLYCLPFAELAGFYGGMGFSPVEDHGKVPSKVIEKYRWCAENYDKAVLLLARTG